MLPNLDFSDKFSKKNFILDEEMRLFIQFGKMSTTYPYFPSKCLLLGSCGILMVSECDHK